MLNTLLISLASGRLRVPQTLLRGAAALAADAVWFCSAGGVRQLERNLSHVLAVDGAPADHAALRRLSRMSMRSYFAYFVEAMTTGTCTRAELDARVRGAGDGLHLLKEQLANGSAPMAMGHQGNWDYAGFWAHDALAPVTTVAERLPDARLLDAFVFIRAQLGMTILLTGQQGLTGQLKQALAKPHTLVPLLADRDLSANGEFVEAFGSTIRVARGPATLAYDLNMPLYVANIHRERLSAARRKRAHSRYGYVVEVSGPVDVSRWRTWEREAAIHAISQAWVAVWAQGITAHPQDWHMMQPLFLEDLDLGRMHGVPDAVVARAAALRGRPTTAVQTSAQAGASTDGRTSAQAGREVRGR